MLNLFFRRRSIREFSSKPVREVDVWKIVEAGQRAPTACGLQNYSVIWVRDTKLKKKVWDACGVHTSIRDAPVVFAICADVRRLGKVLDYLSHDHCLKHGHGNRTKLMSIMDACFVGENMTMAAECLGFGSVYIGGALVNYEVIKALKLPKGVLPLMLLCVGYPNEQPPTRPRWSLHSVLHIDHYQDPSKHQMKTSLKHMDQELEKQGYYQKYAKRGPKYRYSNHIKRKTVLKLAKEKDSEILTVLKKTGFLPGEAI